MTYFHRISPVHFATSLNPTTMMPQNDVEHPSNNKQNHITPSPYKNRNSSKPSPATTSSSDDDDRFTPTSTSMNTISMTRCGIRYAILLSLMCSLASADVANKSGAAGLVWSTMKDSSELMAAVDGEETSSVVVDDVEGLDGGFPSLDGMLQWAIGHSDPSKLKDAAEDAKRLSPAELQKRQMELKELMDRLHTPSDAKLMQIAIDDLNNASLSTENQLRALEELLILVEPIDNANDFNKLGGLVAIMQKLNSPHLEIRISSAWVIGKACQNNPLVQKQVLDLGALPKLLMMVKSESPEEAVKALFAVSAVIRNNVEGQEQFYKESGGVILQDLLSKLDTDIRLRRKAVFLVGDLVECQFEASNKDALSVLGNRFFLKTVVDLLSTNDLDLQEKTLVAVKNLLQLRSTDAMIFKDFCDLGNVLAKVRQQLLQLMAEDAPDGYATDIENLRRDVERIFQEKLQQDRQVPT